jgi:hypothetical protein
MAPMAASAMAASAGAHRVAAATKSAFRRTTGAPPERAGMEEPCGEAL